MDCHGRDIADTVHVPDPAEELVLAEHMVGVFREEGEQVKLLGRKILLFSVYKHAAGGLVDPKSPDLDDVVGLLARSYQPLVPRHVRLHACDEFAGAEGLCHIVVGAQTQPPDLVDVVLFGGDHQDRDILVFTDLPAHIESVDPGQHQVQDHQIEILLQGQGQSPVPARLDLHFEP